MTIAPNLIRRQAILAAALVYVFATAAACWAGGTTDAPTPDPFSQNQRLGRGVNVLGYDPIWKDFQKARFQEKYFRLIHEAGFNHVRINRTRSATMPWARTRSQLGVARHARSGQSRMPGTTG